MPPQLNSDVLAHILSLMDDDSILVAMQVSRWLYTEAAKMLLQRPLMLDLTSGERVHDSFILFANAEGGARFPLFLDLKVIFSDMNADDEALDAFAGCLRAMVGLRRLTLALSSSEHFWGTEKFLENLPTLADAVSSLTTLEDLHLDHCGLGQDMVTFIGKLRSPLRNIDLTAFVYDETDEIDPVAFLSVLASSLEVIVTMGWTYYQDPRPYMEYPKVHSLTIVGVREPLTARYARAFPNLTHLSLTTWESDTTDQDQLDEIRSQNVHAGGEPYWPSLKTFDGSVNDAYLLALGPRTLDRLELVVKGHEPSRLTDVLCDVAPTHLSIMHHPSGGRVDLRPQEGDGPTVADVLRRGSGAASIKTLRLGFGPYEYKDWDALVRTFEDVLDAMRPLQIEEFVWETRPVSKNLDVHRCFAKGREHDFPNYVLERVPSLREVRVVRNVWDEGEVVIRVTRADSES